LRSLASLLSHFKREDIERGFEPDAGFFIQNAARLVGKKSLDLSVDPPPDLILEVDLTSDSAEHLPLYGSFGIPEVWLHDGQRMRFYQLAGQEYRILEHSKAFQWLSPQETSRFIEIGQTMGRIQLLKQFAAWVRERFVG
jgi:Uma2 family endonuclease